VLAFDVGNGSLKYGRFEEGRCVDHGRLPLGADLRPFAGAPVCAAVSVNPAELRRLRAALPGLRVVGEEIPPPLPVVGYDPPGSCGLDRVVGVHGALGLHPEAAAVLLLDAGTCLTATLGVRKKGVLGGAILPGPALMARALATGTAALPEVDPLGPVPDLGRSTEGSIRLGIAAAWEGAARELIRRLAPTAPARPLVVATGTGAATLAERVPGVDKAEPLATLWGVFFVTRAPRIRGNG